MRLTTTALAALFAGCAGLSGPDAIKANGSKISFDSIRAPESVMNCVLRNAERYRNRYSGVVRQGQEPGTYETVINVRAGGINGYGIATPVTNGSQVTVWLNELLDPQEALESFRAGC